MRGALPPWWRHLTGFRSDVYWWEPDGRVARISPGDGIYFMACIHPDGHHTVFWGGSEGRPRLWIADGSSAPEALTDDRRSARFPAYSADGRTLAYSASTHPSETVRRLRRDSTATGPVSHARMSIVLRRADGHERDLTDGRHQDQRPALSPDGKYVAFISDRLGRNGLWITHADGLTPPRPLLVDRPVYRPWWSIDGRRIFFFTFGRRHQVHCVSACGRQADAARERRPRIQPRPIRRPGRSASHRALDARGARGSECLGAVRASARRRSSAAVDATGARAGRARHARAERCRDVRREPHAVAHAMSEPPDLAGNAAVPAPGTSQVQMRVTVELQGEPEEVGLLLAQIAEALVVANVDDPGVEESDEVESRMWWTADRAAAFVRELTPPALQALNVIASHPPRLPFREFQRLMGMSGPKLAGRLSSIGFTVHAARNAVPVRPRLLPKGLPDRRGGGRRVARSGRGRDRATGQRAAPRPLGRARLTRYRTPRECHASRTASASALRGPEARRATRDETRAKLTKRVRGWIADCTTPSYQMRPARVPRVAAERRRGEVEGVVRDAGVDVHAAVVVRRCRRSPACRRLRVLAEHADRRTRCPGAFIERRAVAVHARP